VTIRWGAACSCAWGLNSQARTLRVLAEGVENSKLFNQNRNHAQMPRRPCLFRQSDITKAVRAVQAAGVPIALVEVEGNGRIVVVFAGTGAVEHNAASARNERDEAA
jgi:hypothetical protein